MPRLHVLKGFNIFTLRPATTRLRLENSALRILSVGSTIKTPKSATKLVTADAVSVDLQHKRNAKIANNVNNEYEAYNCIYVNGHGLMFNRLC